MSESVTSRYSNVNCSHFFFYFFNFFKKNAQDSSRREEMSQRWLSIDQDVRGQIKTLVRHIPIRSKHGIQSHVVLILLLTPSLLFTLLGFDHSRYFRYPFRCCLCSGCCRHRCHRAPHWSVDRRYPSDAPELADRKHQPEAVHSPGHWFRL